MAVPAESIVRALGLILSNASVYGPAHAVTRQATESCFEALRQVWKEVDARFTLSDEVLEFNQVAVDLKNRLAGLLVNHLAVRDISDMTLMRDISHDQFLEFIEALNAKPEELQQLGGFAAAIESVGLGNVVSCRKRVYREIAEDEEVVERERLAALSTKSETPAGDLPADGAGGTDEGISPSDESSIDAILAWMQGKDGELTGAIAQAIRDKREDPADLAGIVLEAANSRSALADTTVTEGEAMVDALRRVYTAMTDDPSFHTQKTKKQIQRMLAQIEQELVGRLDEMDASSVERINLLKETVEEMTDELTVDALALEYTRKRSAIETSERRLTRYIKRKGVDGIEDSELKQRLLESGLDETGWQELLARSLPRSGGPGGAGADGSPGSVLSVMDDIGPLVARLVANASPDASDSQPVTESLLQQDLQPIRQALDSVVEHTLQRIQDFVTEVNGPTSVVEKDRVNAPPRLTRKRLFEILAELGQELCQPLAVITCAIELTLNGSLGDVSELQTEMLGTAAEGGEKLKLLIDRLIEIAGMPDDHTVNKQIQSSLYQ